MNNFWFSDSQIDSYLNKNQFFIKHQSNIAFIRSYMIQIIKSPYSDHNIDTVWPDHNLSTASFIASIVIVNDRHWALYFNRKVAYYIDPILEPFCEKATRNECNFIHQIIQQHLIKNNLPTQMLKCYPNIRDFQKNRDDDCGPMSCGYLIQLIQGNQLKKLTLDR